MTNIGDSLIIGYDSCGTDRTTMIVGRYKGDDVFIINKLLDYEAEEMYKKLTTIKKMGDVPPQYDDVCEGYEGNTDEPCKICKKCKLNIWRENDD